MGKVSLAPAWIYNHYCAGMNLKIHITLLVF